MASTQLARLRPAAPHQAAARRGGVLIYSPAGLLARLLLINALTYLRFWRDKRRAGRVEWRVSESELLSLAFIDGSPAAFTARHLLRHKTRKQPFAGQLFLIAAVQLGGLIWLAVKPST